MNEQYRRLREQFHDPDRTFDDEDVPSVRSMPRSFFEGGLTRWSHDDLAQSFMANATYLKTTFGSFSDDSEPAAIDSRFSLDGEWAFEQQLARILFERITDEYNPDRDTLSCPMRTPDGVPVGLGRALLRPDKAHFYRPYRSFIRTMLSRHGRDELCYDLLRSSMKQASAWALHAVRTELNVTRSELNVLLCTMDESYEELPSFFDVDETLRAQREEESQVRDGWERPLFQSLSNDSAPLRIRFYRVLLANGAEEPWTDQQRAWIIRNRVRHRGDDGVSLEKDRTFFRALGLLHDQETFYARSTRSTVRSVRETLMAVESLKHSRHDWRVEREEFNRALKGAKSEAVARDALIQGYEPAFRRFRSAGGEVGRSMLYWATRQTLSTPRSLQLVEQTFEPDQDQLNTALRSCLRGLAENRPCRFRAPLRIIQYLIDRGAEPEQSFETEPGGVETLGDFYATLLVRFDNNDPRAYQSILAHLAQEHGLTQQSQCLYDLLPDAASTVGAESFDPLIKRRILPSPGQYATYRREAPGFCRELTERMPRRVRQSLRSFDAKMAVV